MIADAPNDAAYLTINLVVLGISANLKSQITSEILDSFVIILGPYDNKRGQFIFIASTVSRTDSAMAIALSSSVSSSANINLLLNFMN